MRVFALELDNDIRGIAERKAYIEGLIARLPEPELVLLPELSLCGYIPNQGVWQYADDKGAVVTEWALEMAIKYNIYLGVGYVDKAWNEFYNRYMIVGPQGVCGAVTKCEGEAALFKRGDYKSTIVTPFGKVGVAICYDSRREHFYQNIRDESLSMIIFPHAAPADPNKPDKERKENDLRCSMYVSAFDIPVVYVNCTGKLEHMPGKMGAMMAKRGFRMNGMSRIYANESVPIETDVPEAVGAEVKIHSKRIIRSIPFYDGDITPGNKLFRTFVLKPDVKAGVKLYGKHQLDAAEGKWTYDPDHPDE